MTYTMKSDMNEVSKLSPHIHAISHTFPLDSKVISRIELCVIEAVNNAIEHAYSYDKHHDIQVIIDLIDRYHICIQVIDQGISMPHQLAYYISKSDEVDPLNPETWATQGRGLKLIDKIMHSVQYTSKGMQNILSMHYHIPVSESQ